MSDKKLPEESEKQQKIAKLKRLLEDDQSLIKFPREDEGYLDRFLRGSSYDIDEALQKIRLTYELLVESPDWCTITGPLSRKDLVDSLVSVAIPRTDREGRPVYIVKIGNINPSKSDLVDLIALVDIWVEFILMQNSPEKGLCILIDVRNLPWRALKWLTPENIKRALKKLQGLPFPEYRIHVINESMIVHAAIKLIWPFLPQSLKDMIRFHFADRESFFKDVDPENLPTEYGGYDLNIDYKQIIEDLHGQHDKIFDSFKKNRTLTVN